MAHPIFTELNERLQGLFQYLDIESKEEEVRVLENQSTREDFWNDADAAQEILKKIRNLKEWTDGWRNLDSQVSSLSELFDLADLEGDVDTKEACLADVDGLRLDLKKLELKKMLSGEDDIRHCIISINPGAGGTESQDWASMLYRMYQRYFDKKGWSYSLLDYQDGEEAGIKSATIEVKQDYAYGMLRSEIGVHRLVRISPFDSNARRHTSFTAVYVYPILDDIEYEIDEKDIKVDVYRASGAGGQHVNKTDSAVRMTHIPTGIVVTCQQERSQIQNRLKAMQALKGAVYQRIKEEEEAKRADGMAEKRKIEWGSQIRNYVLQPYQMVKDARTSHECTDAQGVLDGDLDPFIESYLLGEE